MTKAKHDSSKNMRTFNNDLIRSFNPCYDPIKYFKDDEKLNALVVLDNEKIPFSDVLWLLMREEFVSEKTMRLFAVFCAKQVQHLIKDERSLKALDVAEKFANGEASLEELTTTRNTAVATAWDATRNATHGAAFEVACEASWAAAWAAGAISRGAARGAARFAAAAAREAASGAARDAAQAAQRVKLREMILRGVETGDTK